MATPQNPNEPKSDPARHDKDETRQSPRPGHGPTNPLPGEPGGPSSPGHSEAEEPAKNKPDHDTPHSKR
jgi:hypothetical protein